MSERGEALAVMVDQVVSSLLTAVEGSSPEQWAAKCSDGQWTQAFAAYHAAINLVPIAETTKRLAEGGPFPSQTMREIDAENAAHFREHALVAKEETAALIRRDGPKVVAIVRSFSDEQLDVPVNLPDPMPKTTVAGMIEMALVGHAAYHLGTITAAR